MSQLKTTQVEANDTEPPVVLEAVDVSAGYEHRGPNVLHGIDMTVRRGHTVGVVGESGSGKSTLARALVGQLRPSGGRVRLGGVEIGALRGGALRKARRQIQLIPQDPYASLDPRMTVRRALYEALDPEGRPRRELEDRVATLLKTVALDPEVAGRYPHEFSGGQRQRIAIARTLAVEPQVIIADEVTSSLDASVQAEILNLLKSVQEQIGIAMIFITHDLSVASYVCDEICVLYLGRIVEHGSIRLLVNPDHPYTRLLVESIPSAKWQAGGTAGENEGVEEAAGEVDAVADPAHPPAGCPFHPRCPNGPRRHEGRDRCYRELPLLARRWREDLTGTYRLTACHFPVGHPDDGGNGRPSRPGVR